MSDSLRSVGTTSEPRVAHSSGQATAQALFLEAEERAEICHALEAQHALVVRIEGVRAVARGRLAEVIDEAIERELEARGAAPAGINLQGLPRVGCASDPDVTLSDQLFRARRVRKAGIALAIGPLRAALSPLGVLEPADGATLRFWARASIDRPVCLFLDAADATTNAYGEPVALATVLDLARAASRAEDSANDGANDASTQEADCALEIHEAATPAVRIFAKATAVPPIVADPVPPLPPSPLPAVAVQAARGQSSPPSESGRLPARAGTRNGAGDRRAPAVATEDEWRTWVLSLSAARGPQSLAAFERLFARDYMPLSNAIASGLEDARALGAYEEFRRTFSRAYTEASPAFATTGKRPRMVLDAPDVAARIARLHGARSTQVLLVDAMRFDVGARLKEGVQRALGPKASLTDELLLWSALPTTTLRQLETLQRGADALRLPAAEGDRELDPLRGRTAEVIRRVKVGSRELYKLDVVESRVRDLGVRALPALMEIADLAADAVVRHALTLQARTLLFVFGDHGFAFDRDGTARQGGASPEEVLVPAFAFLIGEVH